MMSKVSFFKLLKEDIKRRSWLLALVSIILFITKPVVILFSVEGMMDSVENGYMTIAEIQKSYMNMVGIGQSGMDVLLLMFLAALIGITGYAYLHSRIQQDFYHSLPVRRQKWFLVQFVSGLLILMVPYIICTLLSVLIGAVNGIIVAGVFCSVIKSIMINMLGFLAVYLTCILAMIMTGKIVVGIIGFITFLLYGLGVLLVEVLCSMFFLTSMSNQNFRGNISFPSPIFLWIKTIERWQLYDKEPTRAWLYLGIMILLVGILAILCIWLNTKRKTEAAEHSMAFLKTEGVIKVLLVIPLALAAGLFLSIMAHRNFEVWFFIGIIFGAILINGIIEFIYHLDIREIFVHKRQLILTVMVTLAIGCVFQFDLIGYDSYLPAKEDVEQMALFSYEINGSFAYNLEETSDTEEDRVYFGNNERTALDATAISDFESIYELTKICVENAKSRSEDGYFFSVKYILKNGKSIYRRYWTEPEVFDIYIRELFEQSEYKQKSYPILNKNLENIRSVNLDSRTEGFKHLEITADQKRNLLETYKTELLNSIYGDFTNGNMVANFSLEYSRENQTSIWYEEYGYPISINFVKTLELLEEYGYPVLTTLEVEQVDSITVYEYSTGERKSYTSEKDMKEILAAFHPGGIVSYGVNDAYDSNIGVDIIMKKQVELSGYFKADNIPPCVTNFLKQS